MLVSYVLRLQPDELACGRLVGLVELVETGEQHVLRGIDELAATCIAVRRKLCGEPREEAGDGNEAGTTSPQEQ
ncbi:MAG: hypothetical protein NVS3B12_27560 [Acidimicrobiales bacterium]